MLTELNGLNWQFIELLRTSLERIKEEILKADDFQNIIENLWQQIASIPATEEQFNQNKEIYRERLQNRIPDIFRTLIEIKKGMNNEIISIRAKKLQKEIIIAYPLYQTHMNAIFMRNLNTLYYDLKKAISTDLNNKNNKNIFTKEIVDAFKKVSPNEISAKLLQILINKASDDDANIKSLAIKYLQIFNKEVLPLNTANQHITKTQKIQISLIQLNISASNKKLAIYSNDIEAIVKMYNSQDTHKDAEERFNEFIARIIYAPELKIDIKNNATNGDIFSYISNLAEIAHKHNIIINKEQAPIIAFIRALAKNKSQLEDKDTKKQLPIIWDIITGDSVKALSQFRDIETTNNALKLIINNYIKQVNDITNKPIESKIAEELKNFINTENTKRTTHSRSISRLLSATPPEVKIKNEASTSSIPAEISISNLDNPYEILEHNIQKLANKIKDTASINEEERISLLNIWIELISFLREYHKPLTRDEEKIKKTIKLIAKILEIDISHGDIKGYIDIIGTLIELLFVIDYSSDENILKEACQLRDQFANIDVNNQKGFEEKYTAITNFIKNLRHNFITNHSYLNDILEKAVDKIQYLRKNARIYDKTIDNEIERKQTKLGNSITEILKEDINGRLTIELEILNITEKLEKKLNSISSKNKSILNFFKRGFDINIPEISKNIYANLRISDPKRHITTKLNDILSYTSTLIDDYTKDENADFKFKLAKTLTMYSIEILSIIKSYHVERYIDNDALNSLQKNMTTFSLSIPNTDIHEKAILVQEIIDSLGGSHIRKSIKIINDALVKFGFNDIMPLKGNQLKQALATELSEIAQLNIENNESNSIQALWKDLPTEDKLAFLYKKIIDILHTFNMLEVASDSLAREYEDITYIAKLIIQNLISIKHFFPKLAILINGYNESIRKINTIEKLYKNKDIMPPLALINLTNEINSSKSSHEFALPQSSPSSAAFTPIAFNITSFPPPPPRSSITNTAAVTDYKSIPAASTDEESDQDIDYATAQLNFPEQDADKEPNYADDLEEHTSSSALR